MKVRITATISSNGYIAPSYEKAHRWSFSKKYTLPVLREKADVRLHGHTSLLSLINDKQNGNSRTCLVEADAETLGLIKGLLLYQLADEMVLYVLPEEKDTGIRLSDHVPPSGWQLCSTHRFRDGTQYRLYCRKL